MRVTKKYSKVCYNLKDTTSDVKITSISIPTPEEIRIAKTELEKLEQRFRERSEKANHHAAKKAAFKAARRPLASSAFSLPFSSAVSAIQSQLQNQYLQQQALTSIVQSATAPQNPQHTALEAIARILSAQQQPVAKSNTISAGGNAYVQNSGMPFQNVRPVPSAVLPSSLVSQPHMSPQETTLSDIVNQYVSFAITI
jgi:capsule polysaccharide export protein KpsE/RkpR